MRDRSITSRFAGVFLGGFVALVASPLSCSSGGQGTSCGSPPFLTADACATCLTTTCMVSVGAACNAGGAFSTCYCSCTAAGGTLEACTRSCATSACETTAASCVENNLRSSGACASSCGLGGSTVDSGSSDGGATSRAFVSIHGSAAIPGLLGVVSYTSSGSMSAAQGSPYQAPTLEGPQGVAIDPNYGLVFLSSNPDNGKINGYLSVFSFGATGALKQVPGSPFHGTGPGKLLFNGLDNPHGTVVDPTEHLLFVASNGNTVNCCASVFSYGSSGAVTPAPGSPYPNGGGYTVALDTTSHLAFFPGNTFDEATGNPVGQVFSFSYASSGAMSQASGSPLNEPSSTASYSGGVAVDPGYHLVFITDGGDASAEEEIRAYTYDGSGALSHSATTKAQGMGVDAAAVDVVAHLLFAANQGSNSVSVYSYGASGALTPVAGSPFESGYEPSGVALDTKNHLVFVSILLGGLSAYSYTAAGVLSQVGGSPFVMEGWSEPTAVALAP
jgi:hypothetical protein